MGSKHSKHSKTSRDPYRSLADQAASRINAQHAHGLDARQIAAAVPNGKEPLILMLRKNEKGEYAYDQEYYDRFTEHRRRRRNGEWARERDKQRVLAEREGRGGGGGGEQQGNERVPAGVRGNRGGKRVYAPAGEGEGSSPPQVGREAPRRRGERLGGGGGRHKERGEGAREGEARGGVEADRAKQAFVRRKR